MDKEFKKELRKIAMSLVCLAAAIVLCVYTYNTGRLPIYGSMTEREFAAMDNTELLEDIAIRTEARQNVIKERDALFAEFGY